MVKESDQYRPIKMQQPVPLSEHLIPSLKASSKYFGDDFNTDGC